MPTNKTKNPDDIICGCTGTTKEKVKQLVQTGVTDINDIASKTGATTGCGSCDIDIVAFVENVKDQQDG